MTREKWEALIYKSPQDRTLQLAYADWLEEQDSSKLAAAWRWVVEEGLYPHEGRPALLRDQLISYEWWYYPPPPDPTDDRGASISKSLLYALRGGHVYPREKDGSGPAFREYITPGEALLDLARAKATEK